MKIDSAIKEFSERYDREAMESIDRISKDPGLVENRYSIKGFDIQNIFESFNTYMNGYAEYKVKNMNNPNASTREDICEAADKFIDSLFGSEKDIRYDQLPTFVESYLSGIQTLNNTISSVKETMMYESVEPESIGDVNDFTDKFMCKLQESFYPVMDTILWASGYNARQRMANPVKRSMKQNPVFL